MNLKKRGLSSNTHGQVGKKPQKPSNPSSTSSTSSNRNSDGDECTRTLKVHWPAGQRPQKRDAHWSPRTRWWKGKKSQIGNMYLWRMGYGRDYGSAEKNEAVYGKEDKTMTRGTRETLSESEGGEGIGGGKTRRVRDAGVKVFGPRGDSFEQTKHALRKGMGTKLFRDRGRKGVFKKAGGTGVLG